MARVQLDTRTMILQKGGAVMVTSSGVKLCALLSTTGNLLVFQNIDSAPVQVGASQTPTAVFGAANTFDYIDAAIDGNNVVHIVCTANNASGTRVVGYNTVSGFGGSTNWGAWRTVLGAFTVDPMFSGVAIAIDNSNVAHILYTDDPKEKGTYYAQCYYTNNSASPGTPFITAEKVSTSASVNQAPYSMALDSAGNVHASYGMDAASGTDYYRKRTSGTWGTEQSGARGGTEILAVSAIAPYIAATDGGTGTKNIYEGTALSTLSDTAYDAWNGNKGGRALDFYLSGTSGANRHILFCEATTGDLRMISNNGGGWTVASMLETSPTNWRVIADWSYYHNNDTDNINFIYQTDGGVVYYDKYILNPFVEEDHNPITTLNPWVYLNPLTIR